MKSLTTIKPKLGFVGAGWIGKNRMEAINKSRIAVMKGVFDPNPEAAVEVSQIPNLEQFDSFEALLESDVEGIVLATPSALHTPQALAAIQNSKAVFCQKPLGRNRVETAEVVEAARENDILLEVDFSYRYTRAMQAVKKAITAGDPGSIYSIQLTFHNAYGPDKNWYYNKKLSGGGCLVDLGIHLVDLLFWIFDEPVVTDLSSRLYHKGKSLQSDNQIEDYVASQFILNNEIIVQLNCSWNLSAGRDAMIEARFYGDRGGLTFRNVKGSFYDFVAETHSGTTTKILAEPPDDWQGRAAVKWVEKLAESNRFNPDAEIYPKVAGVLDQIYKQSM